MSGDGAPGSTAPLSALLSRALVAFMIEADNEAEHLMPHRTTDRGAGARGTGPWLVSLTMYEKLDPAAAQVLREVLEPLAQPSAPSLRRCSDLSRTRTADAPRSASPPPCRASRWSCTAAATRTAADRAAHSPEWPE